MTRRNFFQSALVFPVAARLRLRAAATQISVFKNQSCGCCGEWVKHLRASGFDVKVQDVDDTGVYRHKYGVPERLQSCHTAIVEGYAIEGHVPAADIQRLLRERPNAKGLAVPGMVSGSPGMGSGNEAYSVMLFDADGRSSVYQNYPRK